jgi:hypothetical protein
MTTWLIIPSDRIKELEEINAKFDDRFCSHFETIDGVLTTEADKLNDPYWSAYQEFLSSLTPFEGQPIWLTPTEELPE